jgi:hypothetical protein
MAIKRLSYQYQRHVLASLSFDSSGKLEAISKLEDQMDCFSYSVLRNDLSFVNKMLVDRIGLIE